MSARSNFEASAVSKLSANKAEAASVIIRTIVCTCNPKKNSTRIMKTWLGVAGTKVAYLSHPLGSVFLCKALVGPKGLQSESKNERRPDHGES